MDIKIFTLQTPKNLNINKLYSVLKREDIAIKENSKKLIEVTGVSAIAGAYVEQELLGNQYLPTNYDVTFMKKDDRNFIIIKCVGPLYGTKQPKSFVNLWVVAKIKNRSTISLKQIMEKDLQLSLF